MNSVSIETKPFIQAALRYLSIRIRSRTEMQNYLSQKKASEKIAIEVMDYLDRHQLLNDTEFAKAWTTSRLKKGKGELIIRLELRQKGISDSLIQKSLAEIPNPVWQESLETIATKSRLKWFNLSGFQQTAKLKQIFYAHGFTGSHIDAFLTDRLK